MSMHVPVENHTCLTVDLARRVYTYVDLCTSTVESTGKPMGKQKTAAAGGAREYGQSESDRRPSPPTPVRAFRFRLIFIFHQPRP